MNHQPLVYIIILNWNGLEDTVECLKSLQNVTYKNYTIVVVDNGSKNNEASRISKKFPLIKMIKNKSNKGYAEANNQGMRLALKDGADYILLLNNDTTIKPNFLKVLIDYAEAKKFKGVLTPKILYYKTNIIWAMGGSLSFLTSIPRMIGQGRPSKAFAKIIEPDYASGCAFLVNREVIKKVGMLDPAYFAYYEDTDLSYRVRAAGFPIKVIPKSIIWHKVSQSFKHKKINKIGETQSHLLAKNGLLFGVNNLKGLSKLIYLLNQYTTKLVLYIIFKTDSVKASLAYIRGIKEGTQEMLTKNA